MMTANAMSKTKKNWKRRRTKSNILTKVSDRARRDHTTSTPKDRKNLIKTILKKKIDLRKENPRKTVKMGHLKNKAKTDHRRIKRTKNNRPLKNKKGNTLQRTKITKIENL